MDAIEKSLVLLMEQKIGQGVGGRQLLTTWGCDQVALMGLKEKELVRNYLERAFQLAESCQGCKGRNIQGDIGGATSLFQDRLWILHSFVPDN